MTKDEQKERLIKGIAAYKHEQTLLLRLLRKSGRFTSVQFDTWFYSRKRRFKRLPKSGITGETFMLGGFGGDPRNKMLDLIQIMVCIGLVATHTEDHMIVYTLPKKA